jgi:serine/threonine protein kinase
MRTDHRRPVRWLTEGLLSEYRRCNPAFSFKPKFTAPRRVLTNPSIPRHNDGNDNENYDLIMHVGDVLGSAVAGDQAPYCWKQGTRYTLIDMLGQGTFGQVVKCRDEEQGTIVAVKVLKNKPAYFKQGLLEIGILTTLNTNCDPTGEKRTVRIYDHFLYQNHLCIVFELLSMNLYELVKQNGFRGVSARLIRIFVRQILDALEVLDAGGIVHCDLKPENILLQHLRDLNVTLIDFGSACFERSTLYTYIQSRHYRSPEVLLGL